MKNPDIRTLTADLAAVKKAVQKSRGALLPVYFPEHLRLTAILFGAAIVAFCAVLTGLLRQYSGYGLIPASTKTVFWLAASLVTAAIGLLKQASLWKAFKAAQPASPVAALYREVFRLVGYSHLYLGLLAVVLCLVPYLALTGHELFIIPALALIAGLAVNGIGATFGLTGYLMMGYWLILSGLTTLVFLVDRPLAGICLTFGVAGIVFGISGYLFPRDGGPR